MERIPGGGKIMHLLLVVMGKIDKSKDFNSEEARRRVCDYLDDNGFLYRSNEDGCRFIAPACDWYAIGGRYSGFLTGNKKGCYEFKTNKPFTNKTAISVVNNYLTQRDSEKKYGEEYDACVITEQIWDKYISRLKFADPDPDDKYLYMYNYCISMDDKKPVDKKQAVSNIYAVVVDFHS